MSEREFPPYGPERFEIVELGGYVHYSEEMRRHLSKLPREEAERIVAEIEYRARPRRILRFKPLTTTRFLDSNAQPQEPER